MNRLILFCVGAAASAISEIFWRGTSSRSVAFWGGTGMLLLRRILLRFPFASRALLCICGAFLLLALRVFIHILTRLWERPEANRPILFDLEKPSFSYGLYRFLLLAPAYTIIEYLEARFGM